MSENFMGSGTQSAEMSVPNTSMVGNGTMPPNNSICYPASSLTTGGGSSISDEKLSDRLIQVALYEQIDNPPSAQNGDASNAKRTFDDIDFANSGRIPFRHILMLLKQEDAAALSGLAEPQTVLDCDAFVLFLEAAAVARKQRTQTESTE